ncbi:GMC oxidoreductase-like protein [Chaetomium fimeti]|uniref:GMC oxidoreductase-like protein n=1 Tax=Chaetomium fimeti TaxID=1854472 RepID=A0AAE0HC61_9PEZI|nr:GMC oxidoreductase-like protein [Chaetomium fimeti]
MLARSLLIGLAALVSTSHAANKDKYYDYIVVGSGPGGGPLASNLARAGHSVLLIEAGSDQSNNINSEIVSFFPIAYTDPTLRWDFFAFNFANETRNLQHNHLTWRRADGSFYVGRDPPPGSTLLGIHYPRGGTLGGSSAVNAMSTIYPSESDWENIVGLTGDASWSPKHMRNIFERIENNHHLAPGTPGHGFNGYLDTIVSDASVWAGQDDLLTALGTVAGHLGQSPSNISTYVRSDPNAPDPNRDQAQGVFGSTLHADARWRRFTSRDYVLDTANAAEPDGQKKYQLTVQLDTLATKVLFTNANHPRKTPRAHGVEFLQGQSVYGADPRHTASNQGVAGRAYARKEVILSGGTFNSPQLLKLSGIGPAAELEKFNISVVVDLPGVGTNLQDNYEVPVIGHAARDFQQPIPDPDAPACTFGVPGDPCVDLWKQGLGPYMGGATLNSIFRKSASPAYDERDFFLVGGTFALRGFWPPTDSVPADPPNMFGLSTVKINPQSRSGRVLLRSADPRDTPDINFHLFEEDDAGTELDLNAELDTVKWARRAFADVPAPLGPIAPIEPPCPEAPTADGTCDDETDREWIKNQIFGHHPTSTCAIGADSDPMAVLDSKFRVRGVQGLRVVDASAFPRVPGPFPVLPTFMLSEKGTESVLEDSDLW